MFYFGFAYKKTDIKKKQRKLECNPIIARIIKKTMEKKLEWLA